MVLSFAGRFTMSTSITIQKMNLARPRRKMSWKKLPQRSHHTPVSYLVADDWPTLMGFPPNWFPIMKPIEVV